MKKICLILTFVFLISMESYAQDIDVRGGLLIAVGPAPGEPVKAVAVILITDSTGNRAGLDISTGKILQEIPNASCGIERIDDLVTREPGAEGWRLDSVAPSDGIYKVEVIGNTYGKYFIDIIAYDINTNHSIKELEKTTHPGKVDNYEITYSSAPGSQVEVKFVSSSEIPVFDGKGQRPTDVNKFLQYFNPTKARTELSVGTQSFNISIIYGNTIKRETFTAMINGKDITGQFDPLPGKCEIVELTLQKGRNVLLLSIEGKRKDGMAVKDKDRLVFIVP